MTANDPNTVEGKVVRHRSQTLDPQVEGRRGMNPAERLRTAAQLMRERAEACENYGRWTTEIPGGGRAWINTHGQSHALSAHGFPELAEHIAGFDPEVALAVADLLEEQAAEYDGLTDSAMGFLAGNAGGDRDRALAVADAYLGGE